MAIAETTLADPNLRKTPPSSVCEGEISPIHTMGRMVIVKRITEQSSMISSSECRMYAQRLTFCVHALVEAREQAMAGVKESDLGARIDLCNVGCILCRKIWSA